MERMDVGKLEEGAKDRPNKYQSPARLWGAVALPKKIVTVNTRLPLSPYIQDSTCILRGAQGAQFRRQKCCVQH